MAAPAPFGKVSGTSASTRSHQYDVLSVRRSGAANGRYLSARPVKSRGVPAASGSGS